MQLAEAGVHALIEKPVAPDAASARRIAQAFTSRGLVACVGHIERYNPALQEMRRRLANGELGELYQIATRRQGPFPERIADVGVVLDLATHDVDLTAWVAKRPYASLSARTAHRSRAAARGPGRGGRHPLRRHGRQPPRQLAVPPQGAGHGGDR